MADKIKLVAIFFACILFAGCRYHDIETQGQIIQGYLCNKTWSIKTVMQDGVYKTTDFAGMTLSFTPSSYATANGHVMWPSSGTWAFTDSGASALERDDKIIVTIVEVSKTSLILSLTWPETTYAGGRTGSIKGDYEFTFE